MRELEREALRIAREIEGEDTQDLHLAEERGKQLHGDYEMDEEARFSSVFRGVDDSGYDEKENLFDLRNTETFTDVPGSFVNKPFTDLLSGRRLEGAQVPPCSSSRDLVESSQPISGSVQHLTVSENDRQFSSDCVPKSLLAFDRGSRVQESRFSDILADYTNKESETPNLANEAQSSKLEYSHPSSRTKKSFSDKVGLSPNATAYDPTSSTSHGKNSLSDIAENAASAKQHEITRSMNTHARSGSSTSSTSDCGNAIPVSTNTGLSPSSSVGSLASERSTLNPHAKEFKFNPNAKSFTPTKTSFRPASPVSDVSLYYSTNASAAPDIHGIPVSIGMGQSFSSHQPVMYNPQAAPMQSPQAYYYPNGPQYGQQMLLGQPHQVHYMPTYPPEMQYKGREY